MKISAVSDKRPIDRRREGGKFMDVGTKEDGAIDDMIPIGKTLYIVKERSIYTVRMADDIDPNRTNIDIPDVQQKFSSVGSDSDLVSRVLLTARELFNKSYLTAHINCEQGLMLCVRLQQQILAMHDATTSLVAAEESAFKSIKESRGGLMLAAIPDIHARVRSFIQSAEHATQSLYALCKLFYGKDLEAKGKWFDGVTELMIDRYGDSDEYVMFSGNAAKFCKFLRNARHCVEHEKPLQQVVIKDFSLLATGQIVPPTIEVVHPATPEPTIPLRNFMEQMTDSISRLTESLIARLCAQHVNAVGPVPVQVGEVPDNQRKNKRVRYGYLAMMGNQIVRAS
jgi:hypothetical protein